MKNSRSRTSLHALLGACLFLAIACTWPAPTRRAGIQKSQVVPADLRDSRSRQGPVLRFQTTEANVRNYFFRQGPIATHLLTTSGSAPRIVWGFPAENTGIGVWFEQPAVPAQISVVGDLEPVQLPSGMWGVAANILSDAPELRVKKAVLGNVRSVRDYFYGNPIPAEFEHTIDPGPPMILDAPTVDGKHDIRLEIEPQAGTEAEVNAGIITVRAGENGEIRLRIKALINYTPLTPFSKNELLVPGTVVTNEKAFNALQFLAYREKFLAGSWRFLTYFGRDTLLSLRMLMPVLQPAVVEAGLGGVIDRIGTGTAYIDDGDVDGPGFSEVDVDGVVAHEEALGDYAWFTRVSFNIPPPPGGDLFTTWLDYKMIDGDFLLPAVLGEYARSAGAASRLPAFLARKTPTGETYQAAVKRNIQHVVELATPFSKNPADPTRMVSIRHPQVGNWRDSGNGLGLGRYPYDVNVSLVPAALRGAATLYELGLCGEPNRKDELVAMARIWEENAPAFFELTETEASAKALVTSYATVLGLDPNPARDSITGPISYRGLSLDAAGNPVRVMHSDDGLYMLFNAPEEAFLVEAADRILRPFPAGLRTDVGIVVANAVFEPALQSRFDRGDYHGAVIWSWQQAMLAAGLERQLRRTDLAQATRDKLQAAQAALWQVIEATQQLGTGELWSWKPVGGKAEYDSYASAATATGSFVDESNAIQLWSTVYLAVRPPQ
jgi:hypothetical protein